MKQLELPFYTAEEYHRALQEFIEHVAASQGINFLSPSRKHWFTSKSWSILNEVKENND